MICFRSQVLKDIFGSILETLKSDGQNFDSKTVKNLTKRLKIESKNDPPQIHTKLRLLFISTWPPPPSPEVLARVLERMG